MFIKNGHLSWCPTLVEPCKCKMGGYVIAISLATLVAVIEFWGSHVSGSLALLSDAWHVTSDVAVYLVAIWANHIALNNHSEVKEIKNKWAIRNANVLIVVASITIIGALWRVWHPRDIFTGTMLAVALVGMFVNILMFFVLRAFRVSHEHGGHSHDHLHDTTIYHTAADTGISLVVVVVALALREFPVLASFPWIDGVASIAICFVLVQVAQKTKREIREHSHHHH